MSQWSNLDNNGCLVEFILIFRVEQISILGALVTIFTIIIIMITIIIIMKQ